VPKWISTAAGALSLPAGAPSQSPGTSAKRCRTILMVGTDLAALGGIRSVVQGYSDGGLFERFPVTYVATHCDGSAWAKLRRALLGWSRAAYCLATLDAPLVHVHTASRASFWRKSVVCWMAQAAGRPYVLHLHGGGFTRFYHEECGPLRRRIVRSVLARAALVLAVSEEWRVSLERICPEARVEVLPNAVAVPPRDGRRARESVSACPATSVGSADAHSSRPILFLGQLHREKGVLDLVRAFAQVARRFPDAMLLCAGNGDAGAVEAVARELGVAERVHCPGWLDAERKPRALATAAIFVLPSYTEGLPMALLEAMAWGLPVIASPVGGIPQVVQHGHNGLLVAAGDVTRLAESLTLLLSDPARAERLGQAARATIEAQFALDAALARLSGIYARFGLAPRTALAPLTAVATGTAPATGASGVATDRIAENRATPGGAAPAGPVRCGSAP